MDGHRQQAQEILDALKKCNDGLLTIALPASGYHAHLLGNDQVLERSDEDHSLGSDTLRRLQPPGTSQASSSPVNNRHTETAPPNIDDRFVTPPIQKPTENVFRPIIELLYSTCLKILRSMSVQYPTHKETFQGIGDRLEIWGTGLFQGHILIDQALNQQSEAIKLLRNNIAGTLADMVVSLRERSPKYSPSQDVLLLCNLRSFPNSPRALFC